MTSVAASVQQNAGTRPLGNLFGICRKMMLLACGVVLIMNKLLFSGTVSRGVSSVG